MLNSWPLGARTICIGAVVGKAVTTHRTPKANPGGSRIVARSSERTSRRAHPFDSLPKESARPAKTASCSRHQRSLIEVARAHRVDSWQMCREISPPEPRRVRLRDSASHERAAPEKFASNFSPGTLVLQTNCRGELGPRLAKRWPGCSTRPVLRTGLAG